MRAATNDCDAYLNAKGEFMKELARLTSMLICLASIPAITNAQSGAVRQASQQTVESKTYEFSLKSCKKIGDRVICELLVTNKGEDQRLELRNEETRVIDEDGNEYRASRVKFGTEETTWIATVNMVTSVPMKAILTFDGIPLQTQKLTLLEVNFAYPENYSYEEFKVQLRNPVLDGINEANNPRKRITREVAFETVSCQRNGEKVTCAFSVTNISDIEKKLQFNVLCGGGELSSSVDNLGNAYQAQEGSLNTRTSFFGCFKSYNFTLPSKMTVNGLITFDKFSLEASKLALLRLRFKESGDGFFVDFKDLDITPSKVIRKQD
jgi:hypothetical protein